VGSDFGPFEYLLVTTVTILSISVSFIGKNAGLPYDYTLSLSCYTAHRIIASSANTIIIMFYACYYNIPGSVLPSLCNLFALGSGRGLCMWTCAL
jgi:hypothetical protein